METTLLKKSLFSITYLYFTLVFLESLKESSKLSLSSIIVGNMEFYKWLAFSQSKDSLWLFCLIIVILPLGDFIIQKNFLIKI